MKTTLLSIAVLFAFNTLSAQTTALPEFNDKPAYVDTKEKKLVELEKSQYNTTAKAKGIFKAEAGFYMDGSTSSVKIAKQDELKFIVKVTPGTDPTSVLDLAKFEVRGDKRVLITAKAKATSSTNSVAKITYAVEKVKDGYYYLIVKDLAPGEYFFGSSAFMFAFTVQ